MSHRRSLLFKKSSSNPLPVETLVANYKFNDDLVDSVNGYDGVNSTGIAYNSSGMVGTDLILNGSTTNFEIPCSTETELENFLQDGSNNNKDATISFLLKFDALGSRALFDNVGGNKKLYFLYTAFNSRLEINIQKEGGGQGWQIYYTWSPSTATPYHIIIQKTTSEEHDAMTLYIDGVLVATSTRQGGSTGTVGAATTLSDNLVIGRRYFGTAFYFDGNIDEVKFWQTLLTSDQKTYLATQELAGNSVT